MVGRTISDVADKVSVKCDEQKRFQGELKSVPTVKNSRMVIVTT